MQLRQVSEMIVITELPLEKVTEKVILLQPFRILLLFLYEYKILDMEFSKEFINRLFEEAAANPRLRTNVDMRNSITVSY